jgi:hypothetical protein
MIRIPSNSDDTTMDVSVTAASGHIRSQAPRNLLSRICCTLSRLVSSRGSVRPSTSLLMLPEALPQHASTPMARLNKLTAVTTPSSPGLVL